MCRIIETFRNSNHGIRLLQLFHTLFHQCDKERIGSLPTLRCVGSNFPINLVGNSENMTHICHSPLDLYDDRLNMIKELLFAGNKCNAY